MKSMACSCSYVREARGQPSRPGAEREARIRVRSGAQAPAAPGLLRPHVSWGTGLPGHGIDLGLGPEPREPGEEGAVWVTATILEVRLSPTAQQQQQGPEVTRDAGSQAPFWTHQTRNWEEAQESVFRGAPQLTETPRRFGEL